MIGLHEDRKPKRVFIDKISESSQTTNALSEASTPSPTPLRELMCGSHHVADYNGVPLEYCIQMSFNGDMTVDLTHSDFQIRTIKVYDRLVMLNDTDPSPSIATIHDLTVKNYCIVIEGAGGVVHGKLDMMIKCISNTLIPTTSTSHSTIIPSPMPSELPLAVFPTDKSASNSSKLEPVRSLTTVQPSTHRGVWTVILVLLICSGVCSGTVVCVLRKRGVMPIDPMITAIESQSENVEIEVQDGVITREWTIQ